MTHATQRGLAGAVAAAVLAIAANLAFAQPPGAAPPGLPPLFFKEEWQQRALPPNAPPDLVIEGGVTPAAVTNAALELEIYDPNAASVAAYRDKPPTRSRAAGFLYKSVAPLR